MTKIDNIYQGRFRAVAADDCKTDDNRSFVVSNDSSGPFMVRCLEVKALDETNWGTSNCAAMLAMCLNSGLNTIELHKALIQYTDGTIGSSGRE